MMKADLRFLQYTPDFISGTMSLREPQKISLEVLANILQVVPPEKGIDLKGALQKVHGLYPTCTDFEREFLSLTFALATGVGKTRLMGAFITYLYTQYGLKNFFVVRPTSRYTTSCTTISHSHRVPSMCLRGCPASVGRPSSITTMTTRRKMATFS